MTEADVERLLRRRYSPPFFVYFPKFRDATGFMGNRTADGLAIGIYQSRGLGIYGFEIKLTRSDWLAELRQPKKADVIFRFCHRWYLVSPVEIVLPGELPVSWGWIEVKGRRLLGRKEAPELKPEPIDPYFLASIVQRSAGIGKEPLTRAEIDEARDEGYKRGLREGEGTSRRERSENEDFRKRIENFERKSGICIGYYDTGKTGEQYKLLRSLQEGSLTLWARDAIQSLERVLAGLKNKVQDAEREIQAAIPDQIKNLETKEGEKGS